MNIYKGFTLIENIVGFMILSVFTVLSVSIVVQNKLRVAKIESVYESIEVLNTAISNIKKDILVGRIKKKYHVAHSDKYYWKAKVVDVSRPLLKNAVKQSYAKLYEIDVYVYDSNEKEKIHVKDTFFNGV